MLLTLALVLGSTLSSPPVAVDAIHDAIDLARRLEVLEDAAKTLRFEDVRGPSWTGHFRAPDGEIPNHGWTSSAFWYRVRVVNRNPAARRHYLEMPYIAIDRFEVFVEVEGAPGGFRRYAMGDTLRRGGRAIDVTPYVVPVDLPAGEPRWIYLRGETAGALQLPLKLWTADAFVAAAAARERFYGPVYGLVLVLLLYNLVLFALVRDASYGYLALCVAGSFFYLSYFTGMAQTYVFAELPWLANHGYPLAMVATHVPLYLFTRRFLELPERMPRMGRLFIGLAALELLTFPLALVAPYRVTMLYAVALILAGMLASVITGVTSLVHGYRPARAYVLGWTAFCFGVVIFAVEKTGLLPTSVWTDNAHVMGYLATLLVLPLGLADRINLLHREKAQAQARALEIKAEMAAQLEREVAHKTADLKVANEQLAERNAQLQGEIAQRARGEQERVELQRNLFQSQKMEAIGRLAGGVAHDMNNILAAISLTTEGVQAELPPHGEVQDALDDVLTAARRGGELAKNLLGFARRGRYQKERLSLNRSIEEMHRLLRRTIDPGVEINMELAADLADIEGDPSQIGQILVNLTLNAADAMADKGRLAFRTSNTEVGATADAAAAGRYVRLEVSDTGVGMDEAIRARAFEPFFTTKPRGKASGLGLSMVYGAVEAHGGQVTIDSVQGEGTTLTLLFPALEGSSASAAPGPLTRVKNPTPEQLRSGAVLLVDDDALLRRGTARQLERLGYRVFEAEHGVQALEVFAREREAILVVLLDLVMPVMAGPETFARLRALDPEVQVVLCSGYSAEGQAAELLAAGASGFLQKPYALDALQKALEGARGRPERSLSRSSPPRG